MFTTKLRAEKIGANKWILLQPLEFHSDRHHIIVSSGFKTDFTTWWIEGNHTESAVVHDWLLKVNPNKRARANRTMLHCMEASNVNVIMRYIIFAGVTIYGWFK